MLRVGRGRRRRFRGVASQITLLVSIPLIVLLTLAAAGSLWLNWNSRLQNVSAANSDLALAAATAARAIKLEAAEALMRSDPLYEAPDPFTAVVRFGRGSSRELRGLLPRLVDGAAEEVRRISLTGPNETNVSGPLIELDTGYVSIIIAAGNAEGTVTAGLVQVAPDVLGVAWREFVEDRLPEPRDVDVGLVDASGVLLYHSISERVGGNLAGGSDGEGEVSAVGADVRPHFEGGEAITSIEAVGGRWFVMLQRPWSDWREGLNGPGLPVVVLLGAAALVTTSLLTLSASRLTRPLRELASASRAIAAGNFAARTPSIRTGDELEVLADQFDIMRTDLESLYTGLEKRVASRTAELVTVVELAGEVSRTLEAGEIARIAERGLREHPGVEDAAVWLPERTADLAGYQADLPEWVDAEALGKVGGTGEEGGKGGRAGEARVRMLGLPLGDENALLAVACRAEADPEIGAFLEAVAAHITIALSNAILYRRGRSAAALEERTWLARDIHDTLAQSFTGVIVQLEALSREWPEDGGSRGRVARTLELARTGLSEAATVGEGAEVVGAGWAANGRGAGRAGGAAGTDGGDNHAAQCGG